MIPAKFLLSATNPFDLPRDDRSHIAMVGRSNVGKSSMINHLTGQKNLARVSSGPGRTQTINLYEIDKRFFLVDLPGYGYAKASKENRVAFAEMILDYLSNATQLRLVLLVIDARIPLSEIDASMLRWLQRAKVPFVIVLNKMDAASQSGIAKLNNSLEKLSPGVQRVAHSINSVKHRNEVWTAIEQAATASKSRPS